MSAMDAACENLAGTGVEIWWAALVVVAVVLIALGFAFRRGRARVVGVAALLLVVCVVLVAAPASRTAAACPAPSTAVQNSLEIVQTSVNSGLSPSSAPSAIIGVVTNLGPDETFVTSVTVSIGSVAKAEGAVAGSCDPSDYVLAAPRMLVSSRLGSDGGSAVFSGARIGFVDKPVNQDACKGAVVTLLYVSD